MDKCLHATKDAPIKDVCFDRSVNSDTGPSFCSVTDRIITLVFIVKKYHRLKKPWHIHSPHKRANAKGVACF